MKQKIKISGPQVHDVGYRVFLLKHAMNLAIPGLSTYNWEENGQQEVIALVEGDEARIAAFQQTVEGKKPEMADVSRITFEEYDGDVGRTSEVAMLCSFVQLDKAIPLLLDIRDDMKEMKGDMKEMKGDIKEMKCDIKEMKCDIKEMKCDIKAVRKTTDSTLEEITGLREDIQPGYAMTVRKMQSDIIAIKDQIGMH
jgi:acylphosphatase